MKGDRRATSTDIIAHYGLKPHPEGGRYARVYCSDVTIPQSALPEVFSGDRPSATGIVYLLEGGDRSRWHRIASDEIWHFYLGNPLDLAMISPEGDLSVVRLGQEILADQRLWQRVPAGHWFAAKPTSTEGYSLVGCTVSPGFDFADFELADVDDLKTFFPHLIEAISAFDG